MRDSTKDFLRQKTSSLLRAVGHAFVVLAVAFLVGLAGRLLDSALGIERIHSPYTDVVGIALLLAGFALRIWAAYVYYRHDLKVVMLEPQGELITYGPFSFTRNPHYLGGNVLAFFGAALLLGTSAGLAIVILHLVLVDLLIRREERQLAERFGAEWLAYRSKVRRWI